MATEQTPSETMSYELIAAWLTRKEGYTDVSVTHAEIKDNIVIVNFNHGNFMRKEQHTIPVLSLLGFIWEHIE